MLNKSGHPYFFPDFKGFLFFTYQVMFCLIFFNRELLVG